ncbi:replication initiator [Sciscionella marina]|uniref:replication initiator n=1 Tax=Sciscionella marina TaxID=508770 RepID=UPI0003A131DE|nr:replication initiator [Sciscionella marina]
MTDTPTTAPSPERLAARAKEPDWSTWRTKVEAVGGCSAPIHLHGEFWIRSKETGDNLAGVEGRVFVPCGNRREAVCPACSEVYRQDAFHLIRSGISGGKTVPDTVATHPRLFVTLTAPSFGPVHTRVVHTTGKVLRCRCGETHRGTDSRIGTAINPATYDYTAAVLWQAHSGELWHRFTIRLRRELARAAGIKVREFADHARISYAKVAEYQQRGMVHFHSIIRLDGPSGPEDTPPAWARPELLAAAVETAAAEVRINRTLPVAEGVERAFTFAWGTQIDVRPVASGEQLENADGAISDHALAGYIAKYATKGTDATDTADRPFRTAEAIEHVRATEHHKHMMRETWRLGGLPRLRALRNWAHMLGFRGHFLTKSRRYSMQLEHLRNARRLHRYTTQLDALGVTEDDITVINHWEHTGNGYSSPAEQELAEAIGRRQRENRKHRKEPEQ